jgi:hypothetical protein
MFYATPISWAKRYTCRSKQRSKYFMQGLSCSLSAALLTPSNEIARIIIIWNWGFVQRLPSPSERLKALRAECVTRVPQQTGNHNRRSRPVTSRNQREIVYSLPPLGLEPATFARKRTSLTAQPSFSSTAHLLFYADLVVILNLNI